MSIREVLFGAPVDAPSLSLTDCRFDQPVRVVAQPVYGRVLFRDHDALIARCVFKVAPGTTGLTVNAPMTTCLIRDNIIVAVP